MDYLVFGLMHITCAAICASDTALREINNTMSLLVLICSIQLLMLSDYKIWLHLYTVVFIISVALVVYIMGYAGGGDAKLIVAFSFSIPIGLIGETLYNVAMFGGLIAVVYLLKYRVFNMTNEEDRGLPYGVAICSGFLISIYNLYLKVNV